MAFGDQRKPLQRKTGLKRSGSLKRTGIKSGKQLGAGKPRKRLPKQTAKTAARNRKLAARPKATWCQRCRAAGRYVRAVDNSHRAGKGRRPDLAADWGNIDDLCRPCHDLVDSEADQMVEEGYRDPEKYEHPDANGDPMAKVIRQLNED